MVSPHQVNLNDLHGELFSLNYQRLILPYLIIFVFIEKVFFLNKIVLIVKITLRICYIIHFFFKFRNLEKIKSLLEIFIECFCFASCLLEMFNLTI